MNRFWGGISLRSFCFSVALLAFLIIGREATASQFIVAWGDTSSNEDGFKIERKTGTTGTFAQVGTVAVNTTTYLNSNVPDGTTYCYRVRAYNTAGDSAFSGEACGSTPTVPFALSVAKSGTGQGSVTSSPAGISCGSDCSESYTSTTSVTLSAVPTAGSSFSGWSGGGCGGTGTCTLLMNTATSVTATFTATSTTNYTLSVTKVGSGTVTSTPAGISCGADCSEPYTNGSVVSLTATPATGATFGGWSGACTGTGACSVTLNATKTVTATFTTGTGLVAAYSFNASGGATVADVSGNNNTGTISGSGVTWTTGKYGAALAFTSRTGRVTSGLTTHATVRSYSLWTLRTGNGGGGWGRMFDKTTDIDVELLKNNAAANAYTYERRWSGGVVGWSIPRPSANVWHHIVILYDASSAANNPRIYVDGVAQTVTRTKAPSGSPLTNTGPYVLGNRGAGDRGWSGKLDNLRIYNRALTAAEIATDMATAVTP